MSWLQAIACPVCKLMHAHVFVSAKLHLKVWFRMGLHRVCIELIKLQRQLTLCCGAVVAAWGGNMVH